MVCDTEIYKKIRNLRLDFFSVYIQRLNVHIFEGLTLKFYHEKSCIEIFLFSVNF